MISGAIFDCDGTILDTMPLWRHAASKYLSGLGIEVDRALGAKFFEMTLPESARVIREEFDLDSTAEEIITGIYGVVSREYHEKVGLKPGVGKFITALTQRGIPLTVVSSGTESLIRPALARLGLETSFMAILASSETGIHKRQPDMFLTAARLMGAKPEDIWVFEDALYAVRIVKTAGFHPVAIRDEASLSEREALEAEAEAYWEEYPAEIPAAWLR
ncbi:HAD family hydrolase [Mobiluncus mulieris]|uniref:HAD family phosphatase n=1 Tax=Mobiluncus mulieris TaxID=2052 RepID=A0A7Y0YH94_9ACTO|nr:HAD family phosphatase [Mobiluncus mulieris]NMX02698.1 HAD family phosphatase [Mobiluncus mulieris]NMX10820.1 HAD family phosphatase [Mobiluncus mulieris]